MSNTETKEELAAAQGACSAGQHLSPPASVCRVSRATFFTIANGIDLCVPGNEVTSVSKVLSIALTFESSSSDQEDCNCQGTPSTSVGAQDQFSFWLCYQHLIKQPDEVDYAGHAHGPKVVAVSNVLDC